MWPQAGRLKKKCSPIAFQMTWQSWTTGKLSSTQSQRAHGNQVAEALSEQRGWADQTPVTTLLKTVVTAMNQRATSLGINCYVASHGTNSSAHQKVAAWIQKTELVVSVRHGVKYLKRLLSDPSSLLFPNFCYLDPNFHHCLSWSSLSLPIAGAWSTLQLNRVLV